MQHEIGLVRLRILINARQKMCAFGITFQHQLYPASKVLLYFFSARHGEARETLQNLCINSFEHALLGYKATAFFPEED